MAILPIWWEERESVDEVADGVTRTAAEMRMPSMTSLSRREP